MKTIIAILGLILLFVLWLLPTRLLILNAPAWGIVYVPVAVLTFFWGWVLYEWYKDSK